MDSLITLFVFLTARYLYRKKPIILLVPVFFTVVVCIVYLNAMSLEYTLWFENNRIWTFLLGPAVVSLGVLLYKHLQVIRDRIYPLIITVVLGSLTSVTTVAVLAVVLQIPEALAASLIPLGITTPIAIEVTEPLGGNPAITSVVVIAIGILGNMLSPLWIKWLGIRDEAAAGLAIGMVSHGIGTARALQLGEVTGLYSGLAMCLNGLVTVFTAPLVWSWFF